MFNSYCSTHVVICKPLNRHREIGPPGTKVESGVMEPASPLPERRGSSAPVRGNRAGPPGMRDHGRLRSLFNRHNKEAFMARTLALVLVLVVLAGSQPAVLLHRLLASMQLLLEIVR